MSFTSGTVLGTAFRAMTALALAVFMLVPPGYMVGGGDRSGPARIVICTGHGPVTAAIDLGQNAPAKRGKAGASCAYAARAGCAPAPQPCALATAWKPAAVVRPVLASQVSIGRGLAAPPPARAPPTLL